MDKIFDEAEPMPLWVDILWQVWLPHWRYPGRSL